MYDSDDGYCPTSYLILSYCHHQLTTCQPSKIQSLPFDNWANNQDRNGVVDCSVVDRVLVLDLGDLFVIDLLHFNSGDLFDCFFFVIFLIVMFLIWITFSIRFFLSKSTIFFYFFIFSLSFFMLSWAKNILHFLNLISYYLIIEFFFLSYVRGMSLEILFISNLLTLLYNFFFEFLLRCLQIVEFLYINLNDLCVP